MKIDENISKIIAKYILGDITIEEEKILQKWLSDRYNQMLFKKIVDGRTISEELMKLERVETKKSYKRFKKKIQKGSGLRRILEYAAILLIPLGIGFAVLYYSNGYDYTHEVEPELCYDDHKITIVEQCGKQHVLTGKDTVVNLSDSRLMLKNDRIQYEKREGVVERTVYNTIHIPLGKKYKLDLADGTVVHLNSKTTLKYPIAFNGKIRNVKLVSGEAFFDVKKDDKPFVLDFGINRIKVLGTKFNVKSYEEEDREIITLEEGSISLNNSKSEMELLPNQQAVIVKSGLSTKIEIVDASLYSSWRMGLLNYKKEKLSTILNDLERQYNVKMFYQNQGVKNKKLSISINTNKKISQILRAIEATGDVKFEINNSNIIIMKK